MKKSSDVVAANSRATLAKLLRGIASAGVIGAGACVLWVGIQQYLKHYDVLKQYHIDGLPAIVLLSLGIATLATPFFAHSMSQTPGDAPKTVFQAVQLYAGVLTIITVVFSLVLFGLWILGWLRVLGYMAYRMLLRAIGID